MLPQLAVSPQPQPWRLDQELPWGEPIATQNTADQSTAEPHCLCLYLNGEGAKLWMAVGHIP